MVQLEERADRTGVFFQGPTNHIGAALDVGIRADARARVIIRYDNPAPGFCPEQVAFTFTVTDTRSSVLVGRRGTGLPASEGPDVDR